MYPASDIAESRAMGRPIRMTFVGFLRAAHAARGADIRQACAIVEYVCSLSAPRVGSDTGTRMAARLGDGMTISTAVAAEVRYRWALAVRSPAFCGPRVGVRAFP